MGSTGLIGNQGQTGITGDIGPQGNTGPQGPTGITGVDGPQGITGDQGPQGEPGDQGPQGNTGPTGPSGSDGPIGPQGPQGPQGPSGPQGITGPDGPTGDQGPTGETGDIGETGPPGPVSFSYAIQQYAVSDPQPTETDPESIVYSYNYTDSASALYNGQVLFPDEGNTFVLFMLFNSDTNEHFLMIQTSSASSHPSGNTEVDFLAHEGTTFPVFDEPAELIIGPTGSWTFN
jgi:hypothetical protein